MGNKLMKEAVVPMVGGSAMILVAVGILGEYIKGAPPAALAAGIFFFAAAGYMFWLAYRVDKKIRAEREEKIKEEEASAGAAAPEEPEEPAAGESGSPAGKDGGEK